MSGESQDYIVEALSTHTASVLYYTCSFMPFTNFSDCTSAYQLLQ